MSFRDRVDRLLSIATRNLGEEEPVTYSPISGDDSFEVYAIFDNQFDQVDPDTGAVVASNIPRLGVNLNDFETLPVKRDRVLVQGTNYKVVDCQEDGQGGATLILQKV